MKYSKELTGKIIKKERQKRNWTQDKLAGKIDISPKQISKYESGALFPPLDSLNKLCEVFNCELGYLLGEDDYSNITKLNTEIESYIGINLSSIDFLNAFMGRNSRELNSPEKRRLIVNTVLTSEYFYKLVDIVMEYISYRESSCRTNDSDRILNEKYSREIIDKALSLIGYPAEDLIELNLPQETIDAYNLADEAASKSIEINREDNRQSKIYRYDSQHNIFLLIEDIFSKFES